MIQQVDGANTTPYERPGRIEEVEGEAEVENDDGGWVLVEAQRKTRERGQVVQVEKKAEEVRECRGGWDPVQAQHKTRGMAADVVREDRTGSVLRLYPALSKIHSASSIQELMEKCGASGQEEMLRREKVMAGELIIMAK